MKNDSWPSADDLAGEDGDVIEDPRVATTFSELRAALADVRDELVRARALGEAAIALEEATEGSVDELEAEFAELDEGLGETRTEPR